MTSPDLLRAMVGKISYDCVKGDVHKSTASSFRHFRDRHPVDWSRAHHRFCGMGHEFIEESLADPSIEDTMSRACMDINGSASMSRGAKSLDGSSIVLPSIMYGLMPFQSHGAKLLAVLQLRHPSIITTYLPMRRNMVQMAASKARRELSQPDIISTALEMAADEGLSPDTMMTFLAAGHETSAALVDTWTIFLAFGQEISAAALTFRTVLREEIRQNVDGLTDEVRQKTDGLSYAVEAKNHDLRTHPHTVRDESLKLYTQILGTVRDPQRNNSILCPWAINRAHELWGPDADDFNPERWGPGQANSGGERAITP
ncbi:hypothetical protein CEK25_011741 [Fusarium fujikuroi]|nr:hypothetical protein CEK25_011741 [Fusarium fujikuroi]